MFANGTEYICFLEEQCEKCPYYVPFEESSLERPVCFIEDRIARASVSEELFPNEWPDETGTRLGYDCRRKKGAGQKNGIPNPKTDGVDQNMQRKHSWRAMMKPSSDKRNVQTLLITHKKRPHTPET